MQYDRTLTISAAGSRTSEHWPAQTLLWSDLVARLATPARGQETREAYLRLPKAQQDALKDVGGFVGGTLREGRRKAAYVQGRDLVTLDFDNIPPGPGGLDNLLRAVEGLGCAYCVYSTRKHAPESPRVRVLLPLARTATADEYEPVARKAAEWLGLAMADPTTFQASRLMYWPSCCSDSQYVYYYADRPMLDVDGTLALYTDWRDVSQWPQVPGAKTSPERLAAKQADPRAKTGVVGAYCRVYDVPGAIDAYLPGIYAPADTAGNRYTYTPGSTTGGAVVYEGGLYLYSHHATDPAGGQLCNAFDLCRLHLYGALDDAAKPGTPAHRLASYQAMCQRAMADPAVASLVNQERYEAAVQDFEGLETPEKENALATGEDTGWMRLLKADGPGSYERTVHNVQVMLEHDPRLAGKIRLDAFADRLTAQCPLPWAHRRDCHDLIAWSDADDAGLRDYAERLLGYRTRDAIDDALMLTAAQAAYHPVREYLEGLSWDGQPRLDTLLIDYLGAEDCRYTRAVTRKACVAAVARVYEPGIKYDTAIILSGPQGVGKSTVVARLGREWYTDSISDLAGKEAMELMQGQWLIELGELEALNRAELQTVKAVLTRQVDQYRAPYARRAAPHPRQCVFWGTTNSPDYLRDPTGNRRFWPVETNVQEAKYNAYHDLTDDIVGQVWAEARMRYRLGEPLILSNELEAEAEVRRARRTEQDPLQGVIEEFLSRPIPEDWDKNWNDLSRRLTYWGGGTRLEKTKLVPRQWVCALEIWRECLMENKAVIPRREANRISNILSYLEGWERVSTHRFGPLYGRQRAYHRAAEKVEQPAKETLTIVHRDVDNLGKNVNVVIVPATNILGGR